jgi:hypothetical protein
LKALPLLEALLPLAMPSYFSWVWELYAFLNWQLTVYQRNQSRHLFYRLEFWRILPLSVRWPSPDLLVPWGLRFLTENKFELPQQKSEFAWANWQWSCAVAWTRFSFALRLSFENPLSVNSKSFRNNNSL